LFWGPYSKRGISMVTVSKVLHPDYFVLRSIVFHQF